MKIASVQMVSGPDPQLNQASARRLLEEAKRLGAELIALPEYWPVMGLRDTDKIACAEEFGDGPLQSFLAQAARELSVCIVGGTIPLRSLETNKIFNACLVYDMQGQLLTRYDKIHLFGFQNETECYQESNTIVPGTQIQTFSHPLGKVGLGICYDLRFPELFRAMGDCALMILPAAFTHTTGQAHWEILLRARAIENQCYVLASAQGGLHTNGRRTWGHSMIVDPWGRVLDELDEGEGIVLADIDLAVTTKIRKQLPALQHRILKPQI